MRDLKNKRVFQSMSNKTAARLGTASISTLALAAATHAATKKSTAAALVGLATASTHLSLIIGEVGLGNALSKTRKEARVALGAIPPSIEVVTKGIGDVQAHLSTMGANAPKIVKRAATAAKSTTGKGAKAYSLTSAADPKTRRTGEIPALAPNKHVARRVHDPIHDDQVSDWIAARTDKGEMFLPASVSSTRGAKLPYAREIPVAMIADDFTFYSFQPEFKALRLTPSNWKSIFEKNKPQLFFCESAWQGGDPKDHPWQGKVYASVRWPKENRDSLLDILDYCHKHKIPTVFWNKEDPTHFSDRINDFIRTAALFDYVFTTAEECVPSYIKDAGIDSIQVLPFAVQPALFNPQGIDSAKDQAVFAGTWYGNYPRRCAAAAEIMDQVVSSGRELVIFDRMFGNKAERYRFPERFQKHTRPAIPYEQTADEFKQSRFGITLNTVADSRTMFARRVFELAACGTVVLSNYAVGVEAFFGDSVIFADREPERLKSLTEEDYRDLQRRAMNIALDNTYADRAEQILRRVGIPFQPHFEKPAGVVRVATWDGFLSEYDAFKESSLLEQLVVVVSDVAEQSLEFKILMANLPAVSVINERILYTHEFRTRSFLNQPWVVVKKDDERWMSEAEYKELWRHTQHFDGGIAFAPELGSRYAVRSARETKPLLFAADHFYAVLDPSQEFNTFIV